MFGDPIYAGINPTCTLIDTFIFVILFVRKLSLIRVWPELFQASSTYDVRLNTWIIKLESSHDGEP